MNEEESKPHNFLAGLICGLITSKESCGRENIHFITDEKNDLEPFSDISTSRYKNMQYARGLIKEFFIDIK